MVEYPAAREILLKERARLVHQLRELGANESGNLRRDLDFGEGFADAAAVTAERTEVLGIVDSLKTRLDKVDASLARIDDGTYGICARCSDRIAPERMEALPISRLCISCKSASA
jgi:DnaK suppressor protein